MASQDEVKDIIAKNKELVQKVQYWKIIAAERYDEKLAAMKENNELRLRLSRVKRRSDEIARNIVTAIQDTCNRAMTNSIQASNDMNHVIDLSKDYLKELQELDISSPRWSNISGSPAVEKTEKIHRVPPMVGGQSIQPVVALSRTLLNPNTLQSRSTNQNISTTMRAIPMHMLQDVYIPLTRIDANNIQTAEENSDSDRENAENSVEESEPEDMELERNVDETQNMSDAEDYNSFRRLDRLSEDPEGESQVTPPRSRAENPLEGPSWLLDVPSVNIPKPKELRSRLKLEPDSTTGVDEDEYQPPTVIAGMRDKRKVDKADEDTSPCAFTPTVRRRKRTPKPQTPPTPSTQNFSPRPSSTRKNSISGRVLKVVVAKMRFDESDSDSSPPNKSARESTNTSSSPCNIYPNPGKSSSSKSYPDSGKSSRTSDNSFSYIGKTPDSLDISLASFGKSPPTSDNSYPDPGNSSPALGKSFADSHSLSKAGIAYSKSGHSVSNPGTSFSKPSQTLSNSFSKSSQTLSNSFSKPDNSYPNPAHSLPKPNTSLSNPGPSFASPGSVQYASFDAPSPNGATDSMVIVLETKKETGKVPVRDKGVTIDQSSENLNRQSKRDPSGRQSRATVSTSMSDDLTCNMSEGSTDSEASESANTGRSRRNRKPITYKEKPLNRKMRR